MSIKKIERKIQPKTSYVPSSDDPATELRRLVKIHAALTKAKVSLEHMAKDRKKRETGEVIPCLLPQDDRAALLETAKDRGKTAAGLERAMLRELRKIPIYEHFLKNVYGCGPVVSAYLCTYVNIHRAEKPSQLIRYCGYGCVDGKAERRLSGHGPRYQPDGKIDAAAKGTYNATLKTRIYQAMLAAWKNSAKLGKSSKYLDVWRQTKERRLLRGEIKGKAHDAGRRAATELFLYDLYLVWRALEHLPSWVTWYDWVRGYEHGRGPLPRENASRHLTLATALEIVEGRCPAALETVVEMNSNIASGTELARVRNQNLETWGT